MSKLDLRYRILDHLFEKLLRQQEYVTSLRNQAGISAAVTGLIGSIFGTILADHVYLVRGDFMLGFSLFAILALTLFSASIACSAAVVVHYSNFTFVFNAGTMLVRLDAAADEQEFIDKYIEDGEWYFEDNERLIGEAQSKLWFAMVFGFAQIIPFLLLMRGIGNE